MIARMQFQRVGVELAGILDWGKARLQGADMVKGIGGEGIGG